MNDLAAPGKHGNRSRIGAHLVESARNTGIADVKGVISQKRMQGTVFCFAQGTVYEKMLQQG